MIITWADYISLPDAVLVFLQQRSPLMAVPAKIMNSVCEFICKVVQYIESQAKAPNF